MPPEFLGKALARLGGSVENVQQWESEVRRLEKLTPGDFVVAVRQFELWGVPVGAAELFEQLRRECAAKEGTSTRIGFASVAAEGHMHTTKKLK